MTHQLIFAPRQPFTEPKRGNVVLVADTGAAQPQMVVRYDYSRGAQVTPFTGPINSRRKQARLAAQPGETPAPAEWGARWVKLEDITHIATSGRRSRRSR